MSVAFLFVDESTRAFLHSSFALQPIVRNEGIRGK